MNPQLPPERVYFVAEAANRARVAACFELHRRRLADLLPDAEIHHIGRTAVPGSLTKGDLDIQVRIRIEEFAAADSTLANYYERNVLSHRSQTFSSFKDDTSDPPLGIQLTGIGAPEDFFIPLRDYLIAHPDRNEQYNQLKRHFDGAAMDDYRLAKSSFLEALLTELNANVA